MVEEAGGTVTDSRGRPLNFGLGRTLGKNYGIVACGNWVHPKVIDSVKVALKENKKRAKSREARRAAAAAAAAAQAEAPPPRPQRQQSEAGNADHDKENNRPQEGDAKL